MTTTAIPNKYPGPCCECGNHVPASGKDQGFAVKESSGWMRYCVSCSPVKLNMDRKLTKDGCIYMPFDRNALDLLRSLPGAWFDRAAVCWRVSLKEGDRARLLEIADALNLEVDPELRKIELSEQSKVAADTGLYPFQVQGVDWLSKGNLRLLGDDMGLGKTVQTIMALPQKDSCAALVVVPASLKYNWKKELEKWRPELNVSIISNEKSFRLPTFGEVVIANYENLPAYLEPHKISATSKAWELMVTWPNNLMSSHAKNITLIVDEAQRVKNYKTKRSKRIKGLAMSAKNVWGLTGTPLENRPEDLYGILESLQMQMKVFGGWTKFVGYMNGNKNRWGGYEWGRPSPIVPELLRRVMLRRKREDVLPDLPSKTYSYHKVGLPVELRTHMDDLWSKYSSTIKEKNLPPFEEFSGIRAKLAASRIDDLIELVEEHEEDDIPLVVFSAHLEPLNKLAERDGWKKITGDVSPIERQRIVDEFQAGNLKGVAVSIKAGGVGLTLTRAWKAIFVDLDWVPGSNQQAEDRICRIGQESNKIEIVRMVSDHPLDVHVLDLIAWKMSIIKDAVEDAAGEDDKKKVDEEDVVDRKETEKTNAYKMKLKNTIELIESLLDSD
jgi:SWI/SNF-related matrix-associated actin-dependent regulator 1 of chromatin subfamily A